ncbi:MAG: hypothetical protein OQK51_02385 [Kangiellaceae bacterium]|nr:hypothetical protein [Kangiellaceae bacterium]
MKHLDSIIKLPLSTNRLVSAISLIASTSSTSSTGSGVGTGMTIGTRIGTIIRRAVIG